MKIPMNIFKWESTALTHTGKVRTVNEDAYLDRTEDGLWVVADGMGGHTAGDLASQSIVDALAQLVLSNRLSEVIDQVEETLVQVNDALIEEAAGREKNTTIGSTVVVLICWKHIAIMMWVGDSRLYRLRSGILSQLTQDHTQVEELVQRGVILPEEAESHPSSNVITRAVGATHKLFVDIEHDEIRPGDYYLLCSDGLNKELKDEEIAEVMSQPGTPEQHGLELINKALSRNGLDNITLILARSLELDS